MGLILKQVLANAGDIGFTGVGGNPGYELSPQAQGAEGRPGSQDSYKEVSEPSFIAEFFASLPYNPFSWFFACQSNPTEAKQNQVSKRVEGKKETKVVEKLINFPRPIILPLQPSEENLTELVKYVAASNKPISANDPGLNSHSRKMLAGFDLQQFQALVDSMKGEEFKSVKLIIEGHTSALGPEDENLKLSQRRADFLAWILIGLGFDPTRLEAEGRGESLLMMPETGSEEEINEARIMNNRITFQITNVTQKVPQSPLYMFMPPDPA